MATSRNKFDALLAQTKIPAFAAPMFIISNPNMVIAQCRAGIVGSFPALNARGDGALDQWLDQIKTALGPNAVPFAVNQIVHRSNTRLVQDMETCVRHKVPIIITSLGARVDVIEAVHAYGGIVLHDVINDRFAHKAIEKGADGLIAVAAGAGGHAGALSPFALIQEIRQWFDGPLLLSGAIAHGGAILAAQAMGADAAYIGSAFIAATEAAASGAYKQAIVDGCMADIVYTNYFTGVHGNYLAPSIRAAGLDPDNLPDADPSKMNFQSDGKESAKAWKDIWGSGQGIGAVTAIEPVNAIVERLSQEYGQAMNRLTSQAKGC